MDDTPPSFRSRLRRHWPVGLLALALVIAFIPEDTSTLLDEGEEAPNLELLLSGSGHMPSGQGDTGQIDTGAIESAVSHFSLQEAQGQVVVLAFWATWCPACRAEGPILDRLQTRISAQGDQVIGLSVDRMPLQRVRDMATGYGMTYPIALIEAEDVALFKVQLLPTIYVIDPQGRVAATFAGSVTERTLLEAVQDARDRATASLPQNSGPGSG